MVATVRVRDLMEKDIATIDKDATVSEAIRKMLQSGVWSLIVENKALPVGVVTERDILRRCVGKGLVPERVKVEEIMTTPIITVGPDATVGDALKLLIEKDIRRLYVVENGTIIGRVTQKSLLESSLNLMLSLTSLVYQF
jgi:CBS domain-containing protein